MIISIYNVYILSQQSSLLMAIYNYKFLLYNLGGLLFALQLFFNYTYILCILMYICCISKIKSKDQM